jgi:hypothetical protein
LLQKGTDALFALCLLDRRPLQQAVVFFTNQGILGYAT